MQFTAGNRVWTVKIVAFLPVEFLSKGIKKKNKNHIIVILMHLSLRTECKIFIEIFFYGEKNTFQLWEFSFCLLFLFLWEERL